MALTRIGSVGLATGININAGVGTFTGNLTVGGVLTYEDVTNVDSIGIITARAGVKVGSGITLSSDGDIFFTGIMTGNGSGLTGIANTDVIFADKVQVGDSPELISVGLSSDLQLYHNNSSYIDNNTNHLFIRNNVDNDDGGNIYLQAKSGEQGIIIQDDGPVQIYHDNSQVLHTSSSGVIVTGKLNVGTAATLDASGLSVTAGVVTASSFVGDGANLTNVGVDTAVVFTDKITLPDSSAGSINVGLGSDFQIYHDGTNTYLDNSTGSLYIRGVDEKHIYIQAKSGENSIHCKDDEGVELYYDAVKKAETISGGFRVSGLLFGSDTAAANTLDDYEEGTFTPIVLNGWGFLNSSPTVATGKYVRIGAMVYIYFAFKEGSGTGGTTNGNLLSFYNLPYDADGQYGTSGDLSEPINAFCNSSSGNSENTFFRHSSNGATVGGVWKQTTSGHSSFTGTALGSSGQVMVAGWYRISGT